MNPNSGEGGEGDYVWRTSEHKYEVPSSNAATVVGRFSGPERHALDVCVFPPECWKAIPLHASNY